MRITFIGFTYFTSITSAGLTVLIGYFMYYAYRSMGLQMPGLTGLFYDNSILRNISISAVALTALALSLIKSENGNKESILLTNVTVFIFTQFITATCMPFLLNTESLGNTAAMQPWAISDGVPILTMIIMVPFHIMTIKGVWKRG